MNGRIAEEDTPEARLAAVVVRKLKQTPEAERWKLDYADFRQALKWYVRLEILNARREEHDAARARDVIRGAQLYREIMDVEGEIVRMELPHA